MWVLDDVSPAEVLKLELYVDNFFIYTYSVPMRWQSIIVLMAIALSIVLPPALPIMAAQGGRVEIGTLDVCHSATPALSTSGDMPCINDCKNQPLPLGLSTVPAVAAPLFKPFSIAFQDERPPKS
jgi:hypothetical protein